MIISRYLIKEVLMTLLAVTFVLLLVFICQQLVRYLGYAANGKMAANILLQIIGFAIPNLLAILLPLGLFLGIILAYGRLYADNELRVMLASGLSIKRLVWITSILSFFIASIVLILMMWVNPLIAQDKQKVLAAGSADNLLDTLMPGRFQVSSDGRRVAYVEKFSRGRRGAQNIFIAEQEKNGAEVGTPWIVLSAKNGYQANDPITKHPFVVAQEGFRYAGTPGMNDYRIIQFQKYSIRTPDMPTDTQRQLQEAISTWTLIHHLDDVQNSSEFEWRLAIPLSVIVLMLLGIPLSQVKPRQGRYTMLLTAVLIYIAYMNLLFVGRNLIEQKWVYGWIGLSWVHLLVICLVIVLFWRMRRL